MKHHRLLAVHFVSLNLFLILIRSIISDSVDLHAPIKFIKTEIQKAIKSSPKAWHSYVRRFIHKCLKENDCLCKTFMMNTFIILKYSQIFLKSKDKSVKSWNPKMARNEHYINWPSVFEEVCCSRSPKTRSIQD